MACVLEAGPHDLEQVKVTSKPSWSTGRVNGWRQECYLRSQTGPLESTVIPETGGLWWGIPGGEKVWVDLTWATSVSPAQHQGGLLGRGLLSLHVKSLPPLTTCAVPGGSSQADAQRLLNIDEGKGRDWKYPCPPAPCHSTS